jgi:hypothetical protein
MRRWVGSPPTDFFGKKLGFIILARAHELFSFPVSGLIASVYKIKETPDEIKRAIRAVSRPIVIFVRIATVHCRSWRSG